MESTGPTSLAEVRARIDAVDADLVRLLADRESLVRAAAAFKADADAVRAPDRVQQVITSVRERASAAGLSPAVAEAVWRAMIAAFIDLELAQHARTGPAKPPAGLPEPDVARVRSWCEARIPERVRDQIRVECDVAPRHLTIVECRPPWKPDAGAEWTRLPVVRLRYTETSRTWSLYWRDRDLNFHRYNGVAPTADIQELLAEIDRDPTAIFWG
jgi:chorismate mutase